MTKGFTASFQKSRVATSLKHNQRTLKDRTDLENKGEHINWDKTPENIIFKNCTDLRKEFNEIFKPYYDEYNGRQKRNDRKIKDPYKKALNDRYATPTVEFVTQFGDRTTKLADPKDWGKIYKIYLDGFEKRNPNLHTTSVAVHFDELGGPHMHMVLIPIGKGYKRGPKAQANFDHAMGWAEHRKDFDRYSDFAEWKKRQFADWADNERDELIKGAQSLGYDIERKRQAKPHQHLEPQQYRELHTDLETLKAQKAQMTSEINSLYESRKQLYLATSDAWDKYKERYKQLKLEEWQNYHDPAKAEEFAENCEKIRKLNNTLWNLGPSKDDGLLTATYRFILTCRKYKHEKRLREMKQKQQRIRNEIKSKKAALLNAVKAVQRANRALADREKKLAEDKKADRAELTKLLNKGYFIQNENKKDLTPKQREQLNEQNETLKLKLDDFKEKKGLTL